MKRSLPIRLLFFCLCVSASVRLSAQVTSTPSFVTENDSCTLLFDATKGNAGLSGYTGDIYVHIGAITDSSTSTSDWRYVPAGWNVNLAVCKMTSLGSNKWQLRLAPSLRTWFGITDPNEHIRQLAFVFRNADGTVTGRATGGADIFLPVYDAGLNVVLSNPSTAITILPVSTVQTVTLSASQPCTLKLFLNNLQVGTTQTNATSYTYPYTFSTTGSYHLIAEASNATSTVRDSAYLCVRPATIPTATRPSGIVDGINYMSDTQVTLSLMAKSHANVYLLGEFNDWKPNNDFLMKKDGDYFWIALIGLTSGREYAFQYLVDGTILCGDPYCDKILDPWNDRYITADVYPDLKAYPTGKTENVVSVFQTAKTTFDWNIPTFSPPSAADMVIYEMHLRDFTVEGTVKAAMGRLDELQALGVNTLELMPINEFDGNDSWGYNPNFWMATDKAYGTPDDYKRFIDQCHARGMAVILDVVFNHSWGLSPMARMWWDATNNRPAASNPYLFPLAMHPYNVGSDFNHSSTYTRNYFKTVLQYWLKEYHVDGFRFDLSKGFTPSTSYTTDVTAWGNYNQGRIDILSDYHRTVKATNPKACVILEHFAATNEDKALADSGMMLWGNLNYAFGQSAMGYATGSDLSLLTAASRGMTSPRLVGYMESHDEERLAYKAAQYGIASIRADSSLRMAQLGAAAALFLTTPGPKMIWQFGEFGYDTSIEYNGRTGRKPVRWDLAQVPERRTLHDTYAKLLKLRSLQPGLFSAPTTWNAQVSDSYWSTGKRQYLSNGTISLLTLANLTGAGPITVTPGFPKTGDWYDVFSGEVLHVTDLALTLSLEAGSFRVFTDQFVNSLTPEPTSTSVTVYPNPASDRVQVTGRGVCSAEVFDLQGRRWALWSAGQADLNVSGLPAGLYLMRIRLENQSITLVKLQKR